MRRRFSAVLNTPGSTWIYKPLFNLRMLTDTLRYDTIRAKWKTALIMAIHQRQVLTAG
jgi:hypothetical protein